MNTERRVCVERVCRSLCCGVSAALPQGARFLLRKAGQEKPLAQGFCSAGSGMRSRDAVPAVCAGALLPSVNPNGPRRRQRSNRESCWKRRARRGVQPSCQALVPLRLFSQNDGRALERAFTLHLMDNQTNQQTPKLLIYPHKVSRDSFLAPRSRPYLPSAAESSDTLWYKRVVNKQLHGVPGCSL